MMEVKDILIKAERDFAKSNLESAEARANYWKKMYEISNSNSDLNGMYIFWLSFIGASIGWGLIFFAYIILR